VKNEDDSNDETGSTTISTKPTKTPRIGISPADPEVIMDIVDRILESYDSQMRKAVGDKFGITVVQLKNVSYILLRG
jgi:hypothetical protein